MLDLRGLQPLTRFVCGSCGSEKTVPGKFNNYVLLDQIGRGGMGAVYRGMDPLLDRPIALKVLLRSLRDRPELRARFRHEAKAAASINHPNVTQIYTFGEQEGQPYIVMEYVAGKSLDQFMDDEPRLDQAFVVNTGIQVAEGLQAGAKVGLVHGDVKPENVLFNSEHTAKLIDFGLASFADEEATEGLWGSPYYIAPEKVERGPSDERSDIYSLGATLYHALAGRPPFDGESAAEVVRARLQKPPKPLRACRKDVNPEVARIVSRMMSLDLAARYPTYVSLIGDLRSALKELGSVRFPASRLTQHIVMPTTVHSRTPETKATPTPTQRGSATRRSGEHRITSEQAAAKKRTGRATADRSKSAGVNWLLAFAVLLLLGILGVMLANSQGCRLGNPSYAFGTVPRKPSPPKPWDQVPVPGKTVTSPQSAALPPKPAVPPQEARPEANPPAPPSPPAAAPTDAVSIPLTDPPPPAPTNRPPVAAN